MAGRRTGEQPAQADAMKSRLQAIEQDLSKNWEKRDELNRAAERTSTELKEIQERGSGWPDRCTAIRPRQTACRRGSTTAGAGAVEIGGDGSTPGATGGNALGAAEDGANACRHTGRHSQSPENTIRSAILLRAAVPKLRDEATLLADELRTLKALGPILRKTVNRWRKHWPALKKSGFRCS